MSKKSVQQRLKSPELLQTYSREHRLIPRAGDVLASARTFRADFYSIAIVPADPHFTASRYTEAIAKVHELASELGVDGGFTCNNTHYARVASCRPRRGDDIGG